MGTVLRGLDDVIARDVISGTKSDGSKITITVEIGRPFAWGETSPTTWACALRIDPLFSREICGKGSLQALCLAVWTMRSELERFESEGGQLVWDDGASLSCYWPTSPDSY